jgi:hypothetical protein
VAAISILLDNGDLLERLARKRQLKFAIESMISEQYEPKMSPEWRAVWNGMGIGRDKIYFVEQYQKNQVGTAKKQPSTHLATLHPPRNPPPTAQPSTHLATLHPPRTPRTPRTPCLVGTNPPPSLLPPQIYIPQIYSPQIYSPQNYFSLNLFASNLFIPKSIRCAAD